MAITQEQIGRNFVWRAAELRVAADRAAPGR
jgi:hypothetical protein